MCCAPQWGGVVCLSVFVFVFVFVFVLCSMRCQELWHVQHSEVGLSASRAFIRLSAWTAEHAHATTPTLHKPPLTSCWCARSFYPFCYGKLFSRLENLISLWEKLEKSNQLPRLKNLMEARNRSMHFVFQAARVFWGGELYQVPTINWPDIMDHQFHFLCPKAFIRMLN